MSPDALQQAWQAQSSQMRVTIDADLLRKEVQRNQRDFRATILRRDIIEVGVGLLLLPFWIYQGFTDSPPWTWWLGVPAIIWVVGFFLADRWRHPQTPSDPGDPLLKCVQNSLAQVEHQIWLLRNIFWWYLLPFTIALLAYFGHVAWQAAIATNDWLAALAFGAFLFAFVFVLYSFIYYMNQRAVRTQLEPRRQELLALLASLSDETTSAASADYSILMDGRHDKCSPRRTLVGIALLVIGLLSIFAAMSLFKSSLGGYPKKSPFAAVRWEDSQPEVQVGDDRFKLVSIDDLPAAEIVAFSQRLYGNLWRKRFEEDLVELLTRMGHPPQDKVKLVVQSLDSSETRTFEDVPMTEANRQAIYRAARARERGAQQPATRPAD